jgi:hypothetical protein
MGKGSGNGPPKLAGKWFTFWAHRMASYLQAQHHDAWRTIMYPLPSVSTESEAKWNACARNHIFEALDEELFDRSLLWKPPMSVDATERNPCG